MKKRARKLSDRDSERGHEVILAFAFVMKSANRDYIARTGRMTEKMKCAWEVYREWCITHPEAPN